MSGISSSFWPSLGAIVMLVGYSPILTSWQRLCSALYSISRGNPPPLLTSFDLPVQFHAIDSDFDCLFVRPVLSFWYQFSSADLHFSFLRKKTFLNFFLTIFRLSQNIENLGWIFIDCEKQKVRQSTFNLCRCFAIFWQCLTGFVGYHDTAKSKVHSNGLGS